MTGLYVVTKSDIVRFLYIWENGTLMLRFRPTHEERTGKMRRIVNNIVMHSQILLKVGRLMLYAVGGLTEPKLQF